MHTCKKKITSSELQEFLEHFFCSTSNPSRGTPFLASNLNKAEPTSPIPITTSLF